MTRERLQYPPNWKSLSFWIRFGRAQGRCECEGECGLHRSSPGPRRCIELDGRRANWARGLVMLTVAHLNAKDGPCECQPLCAKPDHLKAMCQRCHLRYDQPLHIANARRTRFERRAHRELF